jgi:hypothetical protein
MQDCSGFSSRVECIETLKPDKVVCFKTLIPFCWWCRLFEHERFEASERIMRVAAENEMVLLQEMALAAAAVEPQYVEDE